jgi:hypothetical protein
MTFVNTDGLSFVGPGSEWFWSAVSAVAVVVTLAAIYRQLLVQRSLKEVQQFDEVNREWSSERFVRLRYAVALCLRDGGDLEALAAANRLGDWWDNLASLIRAGHLNRSQIIGQWDGRILTYWTMLRPTDSWSRVSAPDDLWQHFEWLANQILRDGKDHSEDVTPLSPARITRWIGQLQEELAVEEALRSGPAAQ